MMSEDNTVIQEDGFGFAPRRIQNNAKEKTFEIVRRYTMTNKNESSVRLISWGAGIQSIRVPNIRNVLGDVVLGFDDMEGYLKNRYIGRIVNSLSNDSADTKKNQYSECSNDVDRINPIDEDFDNVNWESCVLDGHVIMSHVGRTRGSNGEILIQIKYSWTDDNELYINIRATTTESTQANLTIYCPMNLAGHGTGIEELKNHIVTINADNSMAINHDEDHKNLVYKVDDTLEDFRNPTRLKNRLKRIYNGFYDRLMCINSPSNRTYRFHGRILHPESGRFLEIYSNQSNLKFSTGNDFPDLEDEYTRNLEDYTRSSCENVQEEKSFVDKVGKERMEIRGKDGALYRRNCSFVFSPQNCPDEKSIFLDPGQVFINNITYKFGVKSRKNH